MKKYTIREIAQIIEGKIKGDPDTEVTGIAEIDKAGRGEITFLSNPKYKKFLETTKASCIIVSEKEKSDKKNLIICKDPYLAFGKLVQFFYPEQKFPFSGINSEAVISENVSLGSNINIAPFVFVGKDSSIGSNTNIYPNVTIYDNVEIGENCLIYSNVVIRERCKIGNNVIIHAGAVIGSDGFGYVWSGDGYDKIPQVGIVVIEDDGEIDANCTIDRAALGETIIKKGTKLDNLVHLAHNVSIDESTAIAAQTGISGSTKIGKRVQVGGQAGFAGHIEVGDDVKIGGQAGITKDVKPGIFITGTPARPFFQQRKIEAVLALLPKIYKKLLKLE